MPKDNFREDLRNNMIALLDSKRGTQTLLANAVGEKSSYFSEIKRGNPVNAIHLKAVGIVFGPQKVLELLSMGDFLKTEYPNFKNQNRGQIITTRLLELEKMSPKAFDIIDTYISGIYEGAKATADNWKQIERRSETKEEMGLKNPKNGTDE